MSDSAECPDAFTTSRTRAHAGHRLRRSALPPAGLPGLRAAQLASRGRGAEPAAGETLPRPAPDSRRRSRPRLVRGDPQRDPARHRGGAGQTSGRAAHRARRRGLRRLLRHRSPAPTGTRCSAAGAAGRPQRHCHAPDARDCAGVIVPECFLEVPHGVRRVAQVLARTRDCVSRARLCASSEIAAPWVGAVPAAAAARRSLSFAATRSRCFSRSVRTACSAAN